MNDECRTMNKEHRFDLRARTKGFALAVLRLYSSLPRTTEAQILGKQVLRSGTKVGAHYREATRARSSAEFVSKIQGGLQELEETVYWRELLVEAGIVDRSHLCDLFQEAEELISIFVSSVKTARKSR
jgi:four helix bundle protein